MGDENLEEPSKHEQLLCETKISETRRRLCFVILIFLVFTQTLYMTVPLPFLASEIVETRKERPIVAGVLAGTYPLAGFLTSVIAASVPSKPGCKAVIWGSGLAWLFVSSIAFVIPIFNNNMFSVVVFLLRRLQTRKKVQILWICYDEYLQYDVGQFFELTRK